MQFSLLLGIEYVWIDSYCVIQDQDLDWLNQAAQMAEIYQNSYITLAATASLDNESGCFWHHDNSYERIFQAEAGQFSVRRTLKHWIDYGPRILRQIFRCSLRQWVFQERLLAPRVLHFSQYELV
jgi:hypothetical protein